MTTTILCIAALILYPCALFLIWALCTAASQADEIMQAEIDKRMEELKRD